MGNITTVKILNDYADSICKEEKLQSILYQMLCTGTTGEVVQGMTITDMRHADDLSPEQEELNELRAWKAEAMACTPDMQAIGEELHVNVGQSVYDKILPGIRRLKRYNLNSNDVELLLNKLETGANVSKSHVRQDTLIEIRRRIRQLVGK